MSNKYKSGDNPIHDYLFTSLIFGVDISDVKLKQELHDTISYVIEYHLDNVNDIKFLDFVIKKRNDKYKVIGKNIISALWLSGIIPNDTIKVLNDNKLVFRNIEYTFDEKKFELKLKKIKNG